MVTAKNCIIVTSEVNPWIDFCIVIGSKSDFNKAMEIVQNAYDSYWKDDDAQYETIADWIGRRLTENKIAYEMYFKD